MTEINDMKPANELWTSKTAFFLAATGSAIGLGNIWRFPYMVGENGGGIFVMVYLLCVIFIALPIMMAEVFIGRRSRHNPISAMKSLAVEEGMPRYWGMVGGLSICAGFLILSFYSVFGGWMLAYSIRSVGGAFSNLGSEEVRNLFDTFTGDAERLITWHTMFMIITTGIVMRGVNAGLEKAVRYLIPGIFVMLMIIVGYNFVTTDFFNEGLEFLFIPNFDNFSSDSVLNAMGMAFFSLSIGMGAMMMYGAYLPQDSSIAQVTSWVVLADLLVALLAGMAIFPIVFANGLEPAQGPGLIFNTLPIAFGSMHAGSVIGTLFFLVLLFAAITSAISLMEPAVAWLVEAKKYNRLKAAMTCGVVAWVLGLGTVFSYNLWVGYEWTLPLDLGKVKYIIFEDQSFFDIINYVSSNIILPVTGLLITFFVAYVIKHESCKSELGMPPIHFNFWYFILRYITPLSVLIILFDILDLVR